MASFGELLGAEIRAMREEKGWSQLSLSEIAFGDHQGERRIRDYELGKVSRPQAKVYIHICDAVGISRKRLAELKQLSGDNRAINRAEIDELRAEKGSLLAAINEVENLSRLQLETLASVFQVQNIHELSNPQLVNLISRKGKEFILLREQVLTIDANLLQLSNLKGAAMEAIERGDLEAVDELLIRVQEVELEEAAKTSELRAKNALLLGNPDKAFSLLSACADSFLAIDSTIPILRRVPEYFNILRDYGQMFGGNGYKLAEQIARDAAAKASLISETELLARSLNCIGIALQSQSLRSDRDERTRLSLDCIENYETALSLLGSKSELEVQLRSRILNNLTNGYYALGTSTKGEESRGYLDKGIQVCEECISLRPRENNPTSWARAQNALGNVLHERAVKTNGKDSHHYFHSAEQAYRKYLEVFTRSEYPLEWAQTNENLSIIAINRAGHDSCRNPKNDLLIARTRILECLEVYNPTNMPMLKQKAEEILSVIDGKVRDLGDKN